MQVRVQATGQADTDAIRTETFRGRSYTVVPVVGLVEGILQGLNAEEPEFAPAEEFGKFPAGWNGRPATMNHPRNAENVLVSANDPIILEQYQMGFLANTVLDDTRLKFEAWLDNELIQEIGGEFLETLQRLTSGEDIVEVSTGLFCEVIDKRGQFNGQRYGKSWRNVVPDHLAFLSAGSTGACSVEDGCGAPRLNRLRVHTIGTAGDRFTEIKTRGPINLGSPPQACCDACAKGEQCMAENSQQTPTTPTPPSTPPTTPPSTPPTTPPSPSPTVEESGSTEATTSTEENENGEGTVGREPGRDEEVGESAEPQVDPAQQGNEGEGGQQLPEQVVEDLEANEAAAGTLNRLTANAIDPGITIENVRDLLQKAIREAFPMDYCYVLAATSDVVAYEMYTDDGFQIFAVNYSIDANGGVTFTGEPAPVNLLLRIVPRDVSGQRDNEGASGADQQQEGTVDMAGENQNQTPPEGGSETTTPPAGGEVQTNASGAGAPSAPRTLQDYLTDAPDEIRDVLQEGVELRTQKRNKLVTAIVANSNGQYTAEMLADTSRYPMDELERLNTLCAPRQDFRGRSFPSEARIGLNTNADQAEGQFTVPTPPRAFGKKPKASGGGVNDRQSDADSE